LEERSQKAAQPQARLTFEGHHYDLKRAIGRARFIHNMNGGVRPQNNPVEVWVQDGNSGAIVWISPKGSHWP
jgi:hypothetical protein